MKNLMKISFLALLLSAFAGCRSECFDPESGLKIQLDITHDIINSNPSKAGQSFEKTYSLNLRDTFVKRYNIDPSKLDSVYVNYLYVTFNQDRCKQLQTYEVKANIPVLGNYVANNTFPGCDLTLFGGKPAAIEISSSSTNPFSKQVLTTNFADAIKKGSLFDFTFKMVPKEDFAENFGISIILATRANYKP